MEPQCLQKLLWMSTMTQVQQVEALPVHNTFPKTALKMFSTQNPPASQNQSPRYLGFCANRLPRVQTTQGSLSFLDSNSSQSSTIILQESWKGMGQSQPPSTSIPDEELFSPHHFLPSHGMSSYCFSFHAGMYCWNNTARTLVTRSINPQGIALLPQYGPCITQLKKKPWRKQHSIFTENIPWTPNTCNQRKPSGSLLHPCMLSHVHSVRGSSRKGTRAGSAALLAPTYRHNNPGSILSNVHESTSVSKTHLP